jgi:4-hydroxy-3-polyprenylbenzoate decarboxylase
MAYKNLQDFLRVLERKNLLHKVPTRVDSELEIAAITDRISKMHGPALYFEDVAGSPYPVVTNCFGSIERMQLALGVDNLDDIGLRIEKISKPP